MSDNYLKTDVVLGYNEHVELIIPEKFGWSKVDNIVLLLMCRKCFTMNSDGLAVISFRKRDDDADHNPFGPAEFKFTTDGKLTKDTYFIDGLIHRDRSDGPATLEVNAHGCSVGRYFNHGKQNTYTTYYKITGGHLA